MTNYTNWEWSAPNGKYSALGISKHEGQKGKVNWYGSRPTIEEVVAYVEKRGRKHCDLLIYDNTQSPIKLVRVIEDFNLDKKKTWADDGRYLRGQRRWLNSKETAEYLDKSLYTLQKWRSTGIGPRWGKNGHTVIYFVDDLDKWLEATLVPAGVAPEAPRSKVLINPAVLHDTNDTNEDDTLSVISVSPGEETELRSKNAR